MLIIGLTHGAELTWHCGEPFPHIHDVLDVIEVFADYGELRLIQRHWPKEKTTAPRGLSFGMSWLGEDARRIARLLGILLGPGGTITREE
jgi:hypothetical protein